MPTFYEGEPIATFTFQVEESDFQEALFLELNFRSNMHRQEVKVGICATLAIFFAAMIPIFYGRFRSFWMPMIAVGFVVILGLFFLFWQPKSFRQLGAEFYRSNQLLSKKQTASVYRDSLIYQNDCETITQYWTDFDRCIENKSGLLLVGGEHRLLILKTDVLSEEKQKQISEHMQAVFASKYHRVKR